MRWLAAVLLTACVAREPDLPRPAQPASVQVEQDMAAVADLLEALTVDAGGDR